MSRRKVIDPNSIKMLRSKLYDFLNGTGKESDSDKKRNGRVSKGENTTHNGMSGGGWCITDDDTPEFYKLYCDYLRDNGPLHMTEKSTRIGAMRIDLDFIYSGAKENHLHTQEQVACAKSEALRELVADATEQGDSVLVCCRFVEEVQWLGKMLNC